jgi:cytoplasmic tRNA 2-thiolation protein 2
MQLVSAAQCVNGTFFRLRRCVLSDLYRSPAQMDVQDWKARISIRSFDTQSMLLPPHIKPNTPTSLPTISNASSSLTPHLCYACHTALTSRSSRGIAHQSKSSLTSIALPLPAWANSRLFNFINSPMTKYIDGVGSEGEGATDKVWSGKKMGASDMRDAVKEFLLDEVT